MPKHGGFVAVVRYNTRGGAVTVVWRHLGWWRRYTWACYGAGCPGPRSARKLSRRTAEERAYRHAGTCTRPGR